MFVRLLILDSVNYAYHGYLNHCSSLKGKTGRMKYSDYTIVETKYYLTHMC